MDTVFKTILKDSPNVNSCYSNINKDFHLYIHKAVKKLGWEPFIIYFHLPIFLIIILEQSPSYLNKYQYLEVT